MRDCSPCYGLRNLRWVNRKAATTKTSTTANTMLQISNIWFTSRTPSAKAIIIAAKPCRNSEKRNCLRITGSIGKVYFFGITVLTLPVRQVFHCLITFCSCSNPSADRRAGSSANSRPSIGGKPSQVAVRILRTWPCATSTQS